MRQFDVVIVGAGAVGTATAYHLSILRPDWKVCVVDKESGVAAQQTGHNSGVIHSGVYYKPGSAKATLCRKGYDMLIDFCQKQNIPYDICGKVIVATRLNEVPALTTIREKGIANGLQGLEILSAEALREKEPYAGGVQALWVPQAGIVDYKQVANAYLACAEQVNTTALFETSVEDIIPQKQGFTVLTNRFDLKADRVITCAGLHADKLAKMGISSTDEQQADWQVLPFRGEYYYLKPEREYLVKNLIYPVPNPNFPFLGVHFTRRIHGGIEAGPNAVLAFQREGYSRWQINPSELKETLSFSGFRVLGKRFWRDGLQEQYRSYSKRAFVKALQPLLPTITENDLERGGSGVRAMAARASGELIDDFLFNQAKNIIHVCNAPSPAATASLAIGETIAKMAIEQKS